MNDFILDTDYDKRIVELLKKDAAKLSSSYKRNGLSAFEDAKRSDGVRPNTSFLKKLVRNTDSYNQQLLDKEAESANLRYVDDKGKLKRRNHKRWDKEDGTTDRRRESKESERTRDLKSGRDRSNHRHHSRRSRDDDDKQSRRSSNHRHHRQHSRRSQSPERTHTTKHNQNIGSSMDSSTGYRKPIIKGRGFTSKSTTTIDDHFKIEYDASKDSSPDISLFNSHSPSYFKQDRRYNEKVVWPDYNKGEREWDRGKTKDENTIVFQSSRKE